MPNDTKNLHCTKCDVSVKAIAEPNGKVTVACPICGVNDTYDRAMGEAAELMVKESAKGWERDFPGSKGVKFKAAPIHQGSYRFRLKS